MGCSYWFPIKLARAARAVNRRAEGHAVDLTSKPAIDALFARLGAPAEIAEAYLTFLRGSHITGQSLIVDGGGVLV